MVEWKVRQTVVALVVGLVAWTANLMAVKLVFAMVAL